MNERQQEAVTHVEGPLLIIAGAGTGKTRVLTHRVHHLIQSRHALPEQILALTFTEKATQEMQERLDVLLDYGYGELWVKTFHGFCDAVLRENGLELGLDTDYQLLSQTDTILFLRENLFTFDLDIYRPLGNPSRFIHALASHFGRLRDEMITPAAYVEYAENLLKGAESDEDHDAAKKTAELARAYEHYDRLLLEKNVLDFASLNFLVLKLFKEHPAVLTDYQERFKFVLVDEFQDTNTAQNHLVELLADRHNNVMVVGDDDQSIYKWRGASLTNILHFEKRFPGAKKVVLTDNYRSVQSILDMSYAVIQNNNPHRLEVKVNVEKRLKSSVEGISPSPQVVHFDHYLQEARYVREQIQARIADGGAYRDCAVLVRATAHALPFLEELNRAGIPTYFSGAQGLYQKEEVKDLMALLRALSNPYDDIALFRLLSLPIFGFEMSYVLSLVQQAKKTSTPLIKVLEETQKNPDLFSTIGTGTGFVKFWELFSKLQDLAKTQPTSHILGHFFKAAAILANLEKNLSIQNAEKIQNIASFSQIIKEFELNHADQRLLDCLDYLKARQEVGDRPSPPPEALDTDTVKVLTVHAAKGLEFDTVFVVDLVQHRFPSINRRDPFDVPNELLSNELPHEDAHLAEERRLFYVATTRAKQNLVLTYSDRYDGRKRWKPSIFIQEALDSGSLEQIEDGASLLKSNIPTPLAVTDEPGEKPLVFGQDRAHRSLRTSFSRINTFQDCPLKYKFRYIFSLPEPLSHAASFGSSIHNALNAFYERLVAGETPSIELLHELYEKYWIPLGYTSRAHHDARKKAGLEMLESFYEVNSSPWVTPKFLEKPFTLKMSSGLNVSGRIDRIDRLPDGTYEVIDYKTGRVRDQKTVDKDLQLSIYALACREIFKIDVSKLSLYYLTGHQKISTERTPEQLAATESELHEIAQTIRTSSFEATPSPFACGYCDYRLLCDKAMA